MSNGYEDRTHCKNGHEFSPDNTKYRADGSRECQECRRIRKRKYRADPVRGARVRASDRLYAKTHYEKRNKGRKRLAKRNDDKATAPHNALKPRPEAMPLWEQFQKYFDEHRTHCKDRPEDFSDFNDPRYPDDPLEQSGKPFPSTAQAEALCVDCPVRELCLAYALKQKEDIGVWGGKRIVSGRIYQGGSGRNGS